MKWWLGGAIVSDIVNRAAWYKDDWKKGFESGFRYIYFFRVL